MAIPVGLVNVAAMKKELTVKYVPMGADAPLEVCAYWVDAAAGVIHTPRQYGITACKNAGILYEDHTAPGHSVVFPRVPAPRDYQVEPLQLISECFQSHYDTVFRARTAWGKTLGTLIIAARLGVSTLVVVDQENLKDQWIDSLVKHFGFSKDDVGIIQGKKCVYEGKAVTIAMVQTLSQKTFPQAMYDAFGFVIVDEVHIIGAPTFSKILMQFSAGYRIGISATPKRRDGLQKLLDYNLGQVRVRIDDEHDPSAVYVAYHGTVYSEYANRSPKIGRFINEVTEDASRNLLVAEAIAYLYDTGRDILVLSDRIEQLQHLLSLCYYLGVPEAEMGMYAGYHMVYGYAKDPTPPRRPANLVKYNGDGSLGDLGAGYHYTPISLQLISKRPRKGELERVKTTCRILFATYGKFSKGVDEERLCGGVDASPRSTSEQVQGRILRKVSGKLRPIWITIGDTASYRSLYALACRLGDYRKNNSVVSKWSLEEGKETCEIDRLKAQTLAEVNRLKCLRTVQSRDGLNTLLTQRQEILQEAQPANGTRTRPTTVPRASPALRMASSRSVKSAR